MSGLDNIIKKIENDADLVVSQINRDAEKEIEQIMNNARFDVEKKRKEMQDRAQISGKIKKERLISMANLEGGKLILRTKRDLMNQVIDKVYQLLGNMPPEDYEKLLINMIIKADPRSSGLIRLNKNDKNRVSTGFTKKVNDVFTGQGKNISFSLDNKDANIKGGFILICGDIEINGSFEKLTEFNRSEFEKIIAQTLF